MSRLNSRFWTKEILRNGWTRWTQKHLTIEKRGEKRFWCRIQESRIGYDKQCTETSIFRAIRWIKEKLAEKEDIGTNALPTQEEILELRKMKLALGEFTAHELIALWKRNQPEKGKILTLHEAVDKYVSKRIPQLVKTTQSNQLSKAKWLRGQFDEETLLHEISREDLEQKLDSLNVGPVSRNNHRAFLRAFFHWF